MKLSIYNRFGEKVFETADILKGWDGTYKGKVQDSNTFVFYYSYRFAGDIVKSAKGTVALIR
jgi:gliding motility-associated-like protein